MLARRREWSIDEVKVGQWCAGLKAARYYACRNTRDTLFAPQDWPVYGCVLLYIATTYYFFPAYFHTLLPLLLEAYPAYAQHSGRWFWNLLVFVPLTGLFVDYRRRFGEPPSATLRRM